MFDLQLRRAARLLIVLVVSSIAGAEAQVVRTFVASSGLDSNPCSRTQPCRNFNAAVAAVNAGGEVVALDSAGYGPVLVTKSVIIIAPRGVHAAIAPTAGTAVSIDAPGQEVMLGGLYLNSQGAHTGVYFDSGAALILDSIIANGFSLDGLRSDAEGTLSVRESSFQGNGSNGAYISAITGIARASFERSHFDGNYLGIVAAENSRVSVVDGASAGNFRGFQAQSANAEMNLERCVSANNVVGLFASADATVVIRVSNSTVTNNTLFAIEAQADSQILTRNNNTVEGNAGAETFSGSFPAQ